MFRLLQENDRNLELVAVNDNAPLETAAHLVRYDTTFGRFSQEVQARDGTLVVNGKSYAFSNIQDPADYGWNAHGIDIVLECTGRFTSKEKALAHLNAGARKVIMSAPTEGADATIVLGVNEAALAPEHQVISIGSCTTNCLAPVVKVLNDSFGIRCGWMSTIHSYTNDQRLLDGRHADLRRARAATGSIIPTKTGAAKAIGLVLPELSGKLSGVSVRVPTRNVSLVDLTVLLEKKATPEEINVAMMKNAEGPMKDILVCNNEPLVSIDFNGNPASSIFDMTQTMVTRETLAKVFAWYDNEWGFSNRMLDMAELVGGLEA